MGGWLTATARMVCGCVTHYNGTHGMRVRWLMGNGMSYIMQNNSNLIDSPCVPVGVWVIGSRYTCLSGKGWVIGPRYAWLTSNCTEIEVIGCKLRPFRSYPTTLQSIKLCHLDKSEPKTHATKSHCVEHSDKLGGPKSKPLSRAIIKSYWSRP